MWMWKINLNNYLLLHIYTAQYSIFTGFFYDFSILTNLVKKCLEVLEDINKRRQ